jgi:hypothetical protein
LRFRQASFTIVLFFLRKENLATQTGVQSKNDFRPSLRNRLRSARHTLRKSGVTKKKSVHIAKNRFARPAAAAEIRKSGAATSRGRGEAKILCPPVRGGVRKSFLLCTSRGTGMPDHTRDSPSRRARQGKGKALQNLINGQGPCAAGIRKGCPEEQPPPQYVRLSRAGLFAHSHV